MKHWKTCSGGIGGDSGTTFDVFNLLNSNTTESCQLTYGATYLNPLSIMSARFFKISAQFDF